MLSLSVDNCASVCCVHSGLEWILRCEGWSAQFVCARGVSVPALFRTRVLRQHAAAGGVGRSLCSVAATPLSCYCDYTLSCDCDYTPELRLRLHP